MNSNKIDRKYNIYSKDDERVAEILVQKGEGTIEYYSLNILTEDKTNLPHLLQAEQIDSKYLCKFLKTRVLPRRGHVIESLNRLGIEQYTWQDMIKLNSGRVVTDKFYVLLEENGVELPKSNYKSNEELEIISGEIE